MKFCTECEAQNSESKTSEAIAQCAAAAQPVLCVASRNQNPKGARAPRRVRDGATSGAYSGSVALVDAAHATVHMHAAAWICSSPKLHICVDIR